MAYYYAELIFMDYYLGKVLDAVEARPDADIAPICFFSDHGDHWGDHHAWQKEIYFEAGVLNIHISVASENHHLFNMERLVRLRPDALLINTARGALVEEDALYDSLSAGNLAGAALDVFEAESYGSPACGK